MINCPICKSKSDFLVSKKDSLNQAYDYYKCSNCRFLFDKDFENAGKIQEKIGKVYQNNYFEDIDYGWRERGDSYSKKIKGLLKAYKFFRFKKSASVLDYGGGNGYIASKINGGIDLFYYDKYVKPSYPGAYKIVQEPGRSDVVLAIEVVEHMTDIAEWENLANLSSDALIFTTEVSDGMSDKELSQSWYLRPDVGHVAVYSLDSLHIIAKKYGFSYIFFPSKSFHIFFRNSFLCMFNLVKLEYPFYNFLRIIKNIFKK